MTEEKICEKLTLNHIPFSTNLPDKLNIYLKLLLEWNQKMDLTAVLEEEEMLDRHFLDSLMILRSKTDLKTGKMIDVGTGAGFPGMVLALACPGLQVTLLDAQKKRLDFLQEVKEKTEAKNVLLIHGRAEEYARKKDYREKFDFAAARAVAPLNTLCEYLLPFLRIGGTALCWKGPSVMNEIVPGRNASEILGGSLEMPLSCPVEGRDWKHLILPVRKIRKTPEQYPRKAGTPKTKPLGS